MLKATHGTIEGMGVTRATAAAGGTRRSAPKTVHARKTVVKHGVLMSVPFKTSSKPFKAALGEHTGSFGAVSTVLNPPNAERTKSAAASAHSALPVMTAGCSRKKSVPYHPNASRNRLKQEFKRMPPPSQSTLSFSAGVPAVSHTTHPYMTTSKFAQMQTGKPMHGRVGFTNSGIMADLTRRAHQGRLDS